MKPAERQTTEADMMHRTVLDLLYRIQHYRSYDEYKTINMNLVTIAKEINNIIIKETTQIEEA